MVTKEQITREAEAERPAIRRQLWRLIYRQKNLYCYCGRFKSETHCRDCARFNAVVDPAVEKRIRKIIADKSQFSLNFDL